MAWTPESTAPLGADIDVSAVEESSMKLWQEFLAGYFNGAVHFQMPYPQASLSFQQAQLPQPLDGLNLHVVGSTTGKPRIFPMPRGLTAFQRINWTFFLRASVKAGRADGHNSESLVRWGADALYHVLMSDGQLFPLYRAGILQIRPSPSRPVASLEYAMRSLDCGGTLCFLTKSAPVLGAGGGDTLIV
jgi:hypothetical protein